MPPPWCVVWEERTRGHSRLRKPPKNTQVCPRNREVPRFDGGPARPAGHRRRESQKERLGTTDQKHEFGV